jgi:hypothetical protein
LDSFQRSSNFFCICSYLWDTKHISSAYSKSSNYSHNLHVNPIFFPCCALRNTPSITSRNNNGDRRHPCRTPDDVLIKSDTWFSCSTLQLKSSYPLIIFINLLGSPLVFSSSQSRPCLRSQKLFDSSQIAYKRVTKIQLIVL